MVVPNGSDIIAVPNPPNTNYVVNCERQHNIHPRYFSRFVTVPSNHPSGPAFAVMGANYNYMKPLRANITRDVVYQPSYHSPHYKKNLLGNWDEYSPNKTSKQNHMYIEYHGARSIWGINHGMPGDPHDRIKILEPLVRHIFPSRPKNEGPAGHGIRGIQPLPKLSGNKNLRKFALLPIPITGPRLDQRHGPAPAAGGPPFDFY